MKNLLVLLSLILIFTSCRSFKQWKQEGIRKGWYKETPVDTNITKDLVKDTNAINALIDTTAKDITKIIDSTFKASKSPCDSNKLNAIRDTIIIKTTKYLQNKVKPRIIKMPVFIDDSMYVDIQNIRVKVYFKDGKISARVSGSCNEIITPLRWYEEYWWVFLIIGMILGILLFWIVKQIK